MTVTVLHQLKQCAAQIGKLRSWMELAGAGSQLKQLDDMEAAIAKLIEKEAA